MYSNHIISERELDQEWLHLITEAKEAGLSIEEIRDFLTQETKRNGMAHQLQEKKHINIPLQQDALRKDAEIIIFWGFKKEKENETSNL